MRLPLLLYGALAALASQAAATALTFKLGASDKSCFYGVTEKDNERVAFYFAVRYYPTP